MKRIIITTILIFFVSLNLFAGDRWLLFNSSNSPMEVDGVNNVIVDKNDNVWFTTAGYDKDSVYRVNLYRYKNGKITAYNPYKYLKGYNNLIMDILIDVNGTPWIASQNICIAKYENNLWKQFILDTMNNYNNPLNIVQNIEYSKKNIWVGSFNGLYRIDMNMNFIPPVYKYPLKRNWAMTVWDMIIDKNDNLWFSAVHEGLFKSKGKDYVRYDFDRVPKLTGSEIYKIAIDSNNNIWMGAFNYSNSTGYLVKLSKNKFNIIDTNITGLSANLLMPLGVDKFNNLWLRMLKFNKKTNKNEHAGLVIYDGKTWNLMDTLNSDLPTNTFYSVSFDSHDNIWLGTDKGLLVMGRTDDGVILDVNENIQSDIKITIFPNPATDYIELKNVIPAAAGFDRTAKLISRVKVYDVLGVCVLTHPLAPSREGERVRLDVSGLAAGVYFIRVGGKMYKFVKI